ncbi:butyrophilin subfamily 1 member A1-like [Heterodontus francisci]|uniref:butyrophilin subfamily 1 member A1-like n=1 Tax=Heterodontus francisci TaxID=7792 RepID=UPI00355C1433
MRRYFSVLFLFSILQTAISEKFHVIGPEHPIIVSVSDDVVLPCQLVPNTSLVNLEVRWFKLDFTLPVHLYTEGQDRPGVQDKAYQGRTELFKEEFPHGNASLKLKKIISSDEGSYTCFIDSKSNYEEAVINLKVGGTGQQPWIQLEGISRQGVRLVCKSDGWYPEPDVQWLDGNGKVVTAQPVTTHQKDSSGLFTVLSQIDVTSNSANRFSCLMQNSLLNKDEEAHLQISETFFPKVNAWLVIFWVFVGLLIAAVVFDIIFHKRKRKKIRELKLFCILEGYDNQDIDYASVTLDKDTAHVQLQVSEDLKSVRWTETSCSVPETEKRFTASPCVLGSQGFTSGRHYWVVEVPRNGDWHLGVVAEFVDRKGNIDLKPENGFWTIGWVENQLVANSSDPAGISLSDNPSRIGVYLSYKSEYISFYNASTEGHLYTFRGNKFQGKLFPLLHTSQKEWLKICPSSVKGFWHRNI